jgi:hypothetical protein
LEEDATFCLLYDLSEVHYCDLVRNSPNHPKLVADEKVCDSEIDLKSAE